jgi:hypothetical protein
MSDDERERLHQLEARNLERLFGELHQQRQRRAERSRLRMRRRGIPTEAERRRRGDDDQ